MRAAEPHPGGPGQDGDGEVTLEEWVTHIPAEFKAAVRKVSPDLRNHSSDGHRDEVLNQGALRKMGDKLLTKESGSKGSKSATSVAIAQADHRGKEKAAHDAKMGEHRP